MTQTEVRPALLARALEHGVTNPPGNSRDHGEMHWKSVAMVGLYMARYTPAADHEFVFTFAMIHDLMRENEYEDPLHGARAAQLFVALVMDGVAHFGPYEERTQHMMYALSHHVGTENARDHKDVNVGLCWDANRLTLPRLGIEPEERFLTTETARRSGAQLLARGLCHRQLSGDPFPTWAEIKEQAELWKP